MPFYFLTNGPDKPFDLTDDALLRLKPQYHPYWRDDRFRALVTERLHFADAQYWYRYDWKG